jgi:hypothetical protein
MGELLEMTLEQQLLSVSGEGDMPFVVECALMREVAVNPVTSVVVGSNLHLLGPLLDLIEAAEERYAIAPMLFEVIDIANQRDDLTDDESLMLDRGRILAADLRDDIRSSFAWLATPDGTVPILDEYSSDDEDEEERSGGRKRKRSSQIAPDGCRW